MTVSSTDDSSCKRTEEATKRRITAWVRDVGFGYVKFLHKPELYSWDSMYFKVCMKTVYPGFTKLSNEDKELLWEEYGKDAKDKLCNRRHNVVKAMKDKYIGEWGENDLLLRCVQNTTNNITISCYLWNCEALTKQNLITRGTTLQKILLGPCHGTSDKEKKEQEMVYRIVLQEMLPCVIGETAWKQKRGKELIMKFTKPSDEGFVLVILDNFDETWSDISEDKLERSVWKRRNRTRQTMQQPLLGEGEKAAKPKYSDGGAGATDQGWSDEGIKRFAELCLKVKKWREEKNYKAVQQRILGEYVVEEKAIKPIIPIRGKDRMSDGYNDWDMLSESSDADEENEAAELLEQVQDDIAAAAAEMEEVGDDDDDNEDDGDEGEDEDDGGDERSSFSRYQADDDEMYEA